MSEQDQGTAATPSEPTSAAPVDTVADEAVTTAPATGDEASGAVPEPAQEVVADTTVVEEPVAATPVAEEPVAEEPVVQEPVPQQSVQDVPASTLPGTEPGAEPLVPEVESSDAELAERPLPGTEPGAEPVTTESATEPATTEPVTTEPAAPEQTLPDSPADVEPVVQAESTTEAPVETESSATTDVVAEPPPAGAGAEPAATAAEPPAEPAVETEALTKPAAPPVPKPTPPVPSPAALAGRKPQAGRVTPTAPAPIPTSDSIKFGRVGDDGTVFVKDGEEERAVGSYPEASNAEALAYFARKYDELAAAASLLEQRLGQTELSAHEARESLKTLRTQMGEANVVGDLPALRDRVTQIEAAVKERQRTETAQHTQAKAEATQVREALVVEAEGLAAADVHQIQWKSASARMRGMLDEWRNLQKRGPKLDKDVENALWHRLSSARSTFDKARKAFFSELDTQHGEAKRAKEKLVAEAEALSSSKDWGPTAGAFKRLMQDWRRAGRAQRADDDALWERFKSAQDAFFNAKDEVVAAENEEFRANLAVKEELLTEAEALVPVKDLESTKAALRTIQDKWDAAGKVPREDMSRVEGRLRKVEQAVRDLEDAKWTKSNPELGARAQSMVEQLERAVQGLEQDLEAAKATGNDKKIAEAQGALDARRQWLDSARGGLSEFGG